MPCLFVELLETFFDFGIFTSSSLLTLKLTVASLCNMLRHLDVSAATAVDFPMEVAIFGAYVARVHHASFARQQSHHQSLQILWLLKVENARDNSTDRITGWKTGQRKISAVISK